MTKNWLEEPDRIKSPVREAGEGDGDGPVMANGLTRAVPAVVPHGRVPPHNLDAEKSLLGGLLMDGAAMSDVLDIVRPKEFYRNAHRKVFEAMAALYGKGKPIDRVTLKDELTAMGVFDAVGGGDFVDLLDRFVPTAANLVYYAKIVHEKALRRRTIETAQCIARFGYEQHGSADEFLAEAERRWRALADDAGRHNETLSVPVKDFFAQCGQAVEYILKPFIPKDGFVIVGGAPKGGKTWFVAWLAAQVVAAGKCVYFVEEEGAPETLRARIEPFLQHGNESRLEVAHRKGIRLDEESSVAKLISELKRTGAHVLILDPLMQLHSHARQMGEVPAEVIQAIQRIIRETGCAVVLVHHTRKGESWVKSSETEAQSADLAGSFAWAGSADSIIQIKAVPNQERRHGEVRFYVENSDTRNGEPFPRQLAVVTDVFLEDLATSGNDCA